MKRNIKHSFPQIEVVWDDHHAKYNDMTMEEIEKYAKPFERPTSGYLVHENKRMIVVCSTVDTDEDGQESFAECNFIMKRDLRYRSDK